MTKSTTGYTSKPFGAGAIASCSSRTAATPMRAVSPARSMGSRRSSRSRKAYPIDRNRIVMAGFSMGGASAWSYTVHYADRWAAAAPGAGFSETRDFLRGDLARQPQNAVQQTLWHLYDATDYAVNAFNLPVVAYSGANDGQKQAADAMAAAMLDEGLTLEHVIGPNTGHSYEAGARQQIQDRLDQFASQAAAIRVPKEVRFTTWTLRYNKMFWVTVDAMRRSTGSAPGSTRRSTATPFARRRPASPRCASCSTRVWRRSPPARGRALTIDGTTTRAAGSCARLVARAGLVEQCTGLEGGRSLRSWTAEDATGCRAPLTTRSWIRSCSCGRAASRCRSRSARGHSEQADYAISEWMHFFRGEPRVKNDADVTAADIAAQQPRALRRSVEQCHLQADCGPAAHSVACRRRRGRAGEVLRQPRARLRFSQPPQSRRIRRHQQRLHVPRSGQQRHAVAEAAGLGSGGHHQAGQQLSLPAAVCRLTGLL